ncbi:hypothetical protein HMPREF1624_01058 [Sporothrix schenckii ATCC 58251]|uniref:FAD-binding FR-type domain-containing protein n=1 Tax=Sporothrix schenckii (strain ATCC 58251 / de Perez 2211183) TaxID=1391915 RepID=U7Q7P1_SPOS1|nr:hypothetical protein HMPREF1624_01058 [Sporothrix schenckii ATCC 58251]
MAWPWEFLELSPEERQARRLVLDRYGHYGALFSVSPIVVMLLVRITLWTVAFVRMRYGQSLRGSSRGSPGSSSSNARYDAVPDSPSLKSRRLTTRGSWESWYRRAKWWLSDDVVIFRQHLGQRDLWVGGGSWMAILLVLCVVETGRDYMHLTKRFGIVAVSQLPLQYVLALRYVSPVLAIFGTSHEQVNRWHRVLGTIIYTMLLLHATFYLNFFAFLGNFWPRLLRPVVALGLAAIFSMTLLTTTALSIVRRWSYRVFFITHVSVAFALPVLVIFHARYASNYVAAALLLLIADLTFRKIQTVTTEARIETIPGTELIRLTAPIPFSKMDKYRKHPGSHVYMSLPGSARPSTNPLSPTSILFEFLFNPFTIATVNDQSSDLTLVVRARKGPMSAALSRHACPVQLTKNADGRAEDDDDDETTPAIPTIHGLGTASNMGTGTMSVNLEGPYGSSAYFPELTPHNFDRVLLVAGGVGATFVVPLYRSIIDETAAIRNGGSLKVDLVWSVRGAGDATWAVVSGQDGSGHSLLQDRNVHIFLTGGGTGSAAVAENSAAEAAIELTTLRRDQQATSPRGRRPQSSPQSRFVPPGASNRQRPDFSQIVDDVFRHGSEERVAVLVCGPEAMVQDLRASVSMWVHRGRSVWWHNESFGW